MKSLPYLKSILPLLFLLALTNSYSQDLADSTKLWVIDTKDGNSFMGNILDEDSTKIIMLTEVYGTIQIPLNLIKAKNELQKSDVVEGELWFSNPHATRYF